jgi:subtilisin-like proprotein convertase family protein
MQTGMTRTLAVAAAALLLWGCVEALDVPAEGDDKPVDVVAEGGKEDRWNAVNNPNRFSGEFVTQVTELPRQGRAARESWPSSYWPTYMDSINHRWQGPSTLSPAELYDRAFNGWTPSATFASLRPFNPLNCDQAWDAEYYRSLGPLANLISGSMGNARARNGIDDDGDGVADNCGSNHVNDGLETWWGLCHAWVPAAMLEERPLRAVTHNGVTFQTGDLEALLIAAYNRTPSTLIGGRCNLGNNDSQRVERDEFGRALMSECQDVNPGSFHVIMTNRLGIQQRPFAYDRTYDYEVWNQPVVAFEVTRLEEISVARAHQLLGVTGTTYRYNPDAVKLYDVAATVRYITESHASNRPADASSYERTDSYTYILEVDRLGDIIGGEWYGRSHTDHPDFLWDPSRLTRSSVQYLDLDNVRMLIAMSREPQVPTGNARVFSGPGGIAIPDNNPTGVTSRLSVGETLTVGSLVVELDIAHTYIGDLRVTLVHEGVEAVIHNQTGGGTRNIQASFPVSNFDGMAARGDWTLRVTDLAAQDVGTIRGWKLHITPGTGGGTTGGGTTGTTGTFTATPRVAIPDNNTTGVTSALEVTESGNVGRVRLDLDITHTYIGDLEVVLTHDGVSRPVHSRTGGATHDIRTSFDIPGFEGQLARGTWTLRVRDLASRDVGTLNSWTLRLLPADGTTPGGTATGGTETFPGQGGIAIPDNNATGIRSVAVVPNDVTSGQVTITVNISHTYRGDLKVVAVRGSQTFTLHDRAGGSADDIVQAFPLANFSGSPAGEWTLIVSDHAAADVGRLNSWSVAVTR